MEGAGVCLGYAQVDITPAGPVELIGFGRPGKSGGTLGRLMAQVVIWDDAGRRCCIVAIDSIGFTRALSDALRDAIAGRLGAGREQVMLCFSHTHAGPNVSAEPAYLAFLRAQVLAGVDQALATLARVRAAWGVAQAGVGVNRRKKDGLLDRRIGVLEIVDEDTGRLRLILLRVTAHANVLSSDNDLVSPDFVGAARDHLRERYGCPAVITQGAAGNVRPRYQHSLATMLEERAREAAPLLAQPGMRERLAQESRAALERMAAAIGDAVEGVISGAVPRPIARLDLFSETGRFYADVPGMERAEEIAAEARREAGIDGAGWLAEVTRLHAASIHRQEAEIEIQYFILDEGCWCGVANEAMCEIALDIAARAGDELIYFGGYTNGCDGYLPTAQEYDKGGYEVLWSYLTYYVYHNRVMPLARDTADRLAETVATRWVKERAKAGPAH
jgi:hypothetical protein